MRGEQETASRVRVRKIICLIIVSLVRISMYGFFIDCIRIFGKP